MNFAGFILRLAGWRVDIDVPDYPKCVICVAPHTSNWDFVLGKLAYWSVGRDAGFLMKSGWFVFPLGCFFRALGGVPVYRKGGKGSLVNQLIDRFRNTDRLQLAITPEGTRSRTSKWHTGFLQIAAGADVPVVLGALDYGNKRVVVGKTVHIRPDADKAEIETLLRQIKDFYRDYQARYPEKFSTEHDNA